MSESKPGKPLAVIYFTRGSEDVVKDLAARVRNEGNLANLCYAGLVVDENNLRKCDAILVQQSAGKASFVAELYREHMPEVEVHFFNDDREFCEEASQEAAHPSFKVPEPTDAELAAAAANGGGDGSGDGGAAGGTGDPGPEPTAPVGGGEGEGSGEGSEPAEPTVTE